MGRSPRKRQKHLAAKLRHIRESFKLSQDEIVVRLGLEGDILRSNISSYETDEREPPLYILLKYARFAGVCLDVLVDDDLDLPDHLPSTINHTPRRK